MSAIDLTGQKFGRLTVLGRAGTTSSRKATWLCVCDCGNRVVVCGESLRSGHTKSCGCWRREFSRERTARMGKASAGKPRVDNRKDKTRVTYTGAHKNVQAIYGKAYEHVCVVCGVQAREWALTGHDESDLISDDPRRPSRYTMDATRYVPLCKRCHSHLDHPMFVARHPLEHAATKMAVDAYLENIYVRPVPDEVKRTVRLHVRYDEFGNVLSVRKVRKTPSKPLRRPQPSGSTREVRKAGRIAPRATVTHLDDYRERRTA